MLNKQEAIEFIRKEVGKTGLSHDKFAALHGFNGEVVGATLRGRREPAESILSAVGLERVITYRRKAS